MTAVDDFDEVVEQYHLALNEFFKGNPEPVKSFFSHRDDVPSPTLLLASPREDGSGSLRLWSMPPRSSQMART
jgi:hypothetical protein